MIQNLRSTTRRRPGPALLGLAVLLLSSLALSTGPAAAAPRYEKGEKIRLTGIVTDKSGRPLSDLQVTLEASRSYFSLREFRRAEKDVHRVSARTNAQGEYVIEWPWDSFYNRFELVAGVPVRKGSSDQLHVLQRVDMTRRVLAGSPVVASMVVENAAFVDKLRQFVASVRSDDERRVYAEMGKPDEVKHVQSPGSVESTWWYFASGRAYRFRDGRLEQVIPFEPVKGF